MSRRNYLIFLTILILGLAAFNLFNRFPKPGPEPAARSVTPPTLPVVPADTQWDDKSESDLREWEAEIEELFEPGSNAVRFSAVVGEGETLVTEVIEKSPGIFHLTTLTPSRTVSDDTGEETITIRSERLEMTLDGGLDKMIAPAIVLAPGTIGAVSVFSDEGLYRMSVSARPVENGIELNGSVTE